MGKIDKKHPLPKRDELIEITDRYCSEKANNTKSGTFAEYVHDMIGDVYKVSSDKQEWRPSTEHPAIDEEVIALIGEYNKISFAHIVYKNKAIDYDGWNIPDVRWWIPCPKIEEDRLMENAKKSIEQMAKEANGRSRACVNCSLFMSCNMITRKICSDAFIEGYIKGYKQGRKG